MGVICIAEPLSREQFERFRAAQLSCPPSYPPSRAPTCEEVRNALAQMHGYEVTVERESSAELEAWVSRVGEHDATDLICRSKYHISLYKGSKELVVSILQQLAPLCGAFAVGCDSDNDTFVVGPGFDPEQELADPYP